MTSVTSFTRTPRGLPRDQWAPSRTRCATRHLHYSVAVRPILPSFAKEAKSLLSFSYRSSRERSNTFSLLSSVEQSLKDWTRRDDEEGGRFGKVGEIVSRLGFTVERIGDGFVAAVSMPPGARRGVGVREGKKDRERERVKGDEEGRWCGALVATGAVQLPPRNEGRPL